VKNILFLANQIFLIIKLSIPHPEIEVLEKEQSQINSKLQPFYSTTDRLRIKG